MVVDLDGWREVDCSQSSAVPSLSLGAMSVVGFATHVNRSVLTFVYVQIVSRVGPNTHDVLLPYLSTGLDRHDRQCTVLLVNSYGIVVQFMFPPRC